MSKQLFIVTRKSLHSTVKFAIAATTAVEAIKEVRSGEDDLDNHHADFKKRVQWSAEAPVMGYIQIS